MEGLNNHNRRIGSSCFPWTGSRNENQEYKRMPALVLRNKEVPKVKEYIVIGKGMASQNVNAVSTDETINPPSVANVNADSLKLTDENLRKIEAAKNMKQMWQHMAASNYVDMHDIESKIAREKYLETFLEKRRLEIKLKNDEDDNKKKTGILADEVYNFYLKTGKFPVAEEMANIRQPAAPPVNADQRRHQQQNEQQF